MVGVGTTGEARQPYPSAGRADDDHVADRDRAGHDQVEIGEELHAAWPDEVTASFVARERGLVDEGDAGATAREHQRGDTAGRPGADNQGVEAIVDQNPPESST